MFFCQKSESPLITDLSSGVNIPLHRQVGGAPHQAPGDEGVVHGYNHQRNDVENEEGGHGVNLRVHFSGVGIRSTGDETFISGGDVEAVEVGENGLRDRQDEGDEPDERRLQDDAGSAA